MKKAQAKFISDQFLNAFTGQYDRVDINQLPVLENILAKIGFEFTQKAKENLKKANAIASGNLFDMSIPRVYENNLGGYTLEVGYPIGSKQDKYYDFVNKGVKGTKNRKSNQGTPYSFKTSKKSIPSEPIEKWLQYNKLKAVSVSKYRKLGVEQKAVDAKKSLARYLAMKIHREGIRATKYFDDALKIITTQDFQDSLSEALKGDVIIEIKKLEKKK